MSINLVGTNYAENADGVADPYASATRATFMTWFQFTANQAAAGFFGTGESHDGTNLQRLWLSFAPGGTLSLLRAALNATVSPNQNSIWTRNSAISPGLYMFMETYDGTQGAGFASRIGIYLNDTDDEANGTFTGTTPGTQLIFASAANVLDVGSVFTNGFGLRGLYNGCICSCAGWVGQTATLANVQAIYALGASGDLSTSPLGLPTNWYRLQSNLDDSGGTPFNLTQQGTPAVAFGCPGGDPSCGAGVTVAPLDTEFYLRARRFR